MVDKMRNLERKIHYKFSSDLSYIAVREAILLAAILPSTVAVTANADHRFVLNVTDTTSLGGLAL